GTGGAGLRGSGGTGSRSSSGRSGGGGSLSGTAVFSQSHAGARRPQPRWRSRELPGPVPHGIPRLRGGGRRGAHHRAGRGPDPRVALHLPRNGRRPGGAGRCRGGDRPRAHPAAAHRDAAGRGRAAGRVRPAVAAQGHPACVRVQGPARRGGHLHAPGRGGAGRHRRGGGAGRGEGGGSAARARGGVRDWYAFTLAFKGVLLEGLEVVFIALTFGANQQNLGLAAAGAAVAVVVVAGVGVAVRAPLSRVPENTMKFAVGVMLTSFGVFWGAEGAGASWPGN